MTDTAMGKKVTIGCPFCGRLNRVDLARAADRPKCGECGRPILLDRPVMATDDSFQRMISDSEVPVLVDFYADWCGPCKVMAPHLDELARARMGEALIVKLNTDLNQATARSFQIHGIPTLILFRGGREVRRQVGAVSRQLLEEMLRS